MKSRFAKVEEVFSKEFEEINQQLLLINQQYNLIDHANLNKERFYWADKITAKPIFYASRLWEFPFAILAAELSKGMKCADIGCGTTPFTAYLAEAVGADNVTGFDPDFIEDDQTLSHYAFGARKSFIDKVGFHFQKDNITKLHVPDETFDCVFCISVLEHIDDVEVKQKGLKELVRILKPGGKLILTFDMGIQLPLNNHLDILKWTGLPPSGELDLRWPKERFVQYPDTTMDVYGLVLEKSTEQIFSDYTQKETLPQWQANHKYVRLADWYTVPYSSIMVARDYKRTLGPWRVWVKRLLNRY